MPFKGLSHDRNLSSDNPQEVVIYTLQKVELNIFIYNENSYVEKKGSNIADISDIQNNNSRQCVWVEVIGPVEQRNNIVQQLGIHFNLHPLTLEDIQTIEERTKLEIFDDGIYLLMKMVYICEHSHTRIEQQQISFYLKGNILITFQEKYASVSLPIKQRLLSRRGKLTSLKSDYLFYCLVDSIVDNYMVVVVDFIGLKIEHIEDELMRMKSLKLHTLKLIYNLKHDMLHFRIMCSPLKDIVIKLQKAYDRMPRRDSFAAHRQGLRSLKKKRHRRVSRQISTRLLQRITSRGQSLSPTRINTLQSMKSRRRRSVSPIRSSTTLRRKSKAPTFRDDITVLNEYIFMYFKHLHVHILQVNNAVETYSDMVSWLANFYMALNGNAVNKTIKLLTMMHIVFYPMLFIHGLNSMNFMWVPQRDNYENSYFIFLGVLAVIVLTMVTWFKIQKWF